MKSKESLCIIDAPLCYKGHKVFRAYGRMFAVPDRLPARKMLVTKKLFSHPAVLSGATREEVVALIDGLGEITRPLGDYQGYRMLLHRGLYLGIPESAPDIDLDLGEERQRAAVLEAASLPELQAGIDRKRTSVPVEFAGWLPVYETSGNCGKHPQFTHIASPPDGYHFTCSAPAGWKPSATLLDWCIGSLWSPVRALIRFLIALLWGVRGVGFFTRIRVLGCMARLYGRLVKNGAGFMSAMQFLQTRHLQSQLLLANHKGLVFLTSMPYTYGQNPWILEIEDPTTLFYPLVHNGLTSNLDVRRCAYYPILKTMLESEQCRGVLTHMRSTAELIPRLFDSEIIRRKVQFHPLGVRVPERYQTHEKGDGLIHLLFINSWCQVPTNFYVRGGLDVLEAFRILHERYPQVRLTIRSSLPSLALHFHKIMQSGWVRIIDRFLTVEEMADLHATSHIFLLPAARVHIVSMLQAMAHGLAVVASDGWGIEEYLDHERNGLVVKGRYGKTSWIDHEVGILREDYESMHLIDPVIVEGLVTSVSRLIEDRAFRANLGRTARTDVETRYNLTEWNRGLKMAFDRALGAGMPVEALPGLRVLPA